MSHMSEMTVLERASVLSDQFYLALSGQIPVKQYLEFTVYYKDEEDPNVTSVICNQFSEMTYWWMTMLALHFRRSFEIGLPMRRSNSDGRQ